jgi:hypothetical protein
LELGDLLGDVVEGLGDGAQGLGVQVEAHLEQIVELAQSVARHHLAPARPVAHDRDLFDTKKKEKKKEKRTILTKILI